jgi:uncharacterized membrane protein (DUF2068 family)
MAARRERLVVWIGIFKLVKATLLIALGVAGLAAGPARVAHRAARIVAWIGIFPGRHVVQEGIARLLSMNHLTAARVSALSFAYAAVFLVEGIGLLRRKRWAEWLTVFVTGSFIPLEIYELVERFGPGKVVALALNVAIVVYLAWRRIHERRGAAATMRRMLRAV